MIYSRTTCYNLLVASLEQSVLPQLSTQDAQMVGAITVDALRQFAKYEEREPTLVAESFPLGLALGKEALNILSGSASPNYEKLAANLALVEEAHLLNQERDSEGLIRIFNQLMAALDHVAKEMLDLSEQASMDIKERITNNLRDIAEWELHYHEAMMEPHAFPPLLKDAPPKQLTAEKLEKRLKSVSAKPSDIRVTKFGAISGGMSKETFLVTVEDSVSGTHEMVARKTDKVPVFDFLNSKLSREYALVKRVHELGLPVAEPYWYFESDAETDGDFYVMEKMEGKVLGTTFEAFEPLQEELLLNLAAYFARQHAIKLELFAEYIHEHDNPAVLNETCEQTIQRYIKDLQGRWKEFARFPSPGEAHTLNWLLNHIPPNHNKPVLVHGDCTITNFLAKDDKITAVMDWEGAHFGDPAEDIGYVRAMVSRYMDWNKFVAYYKACGGQPIDESSMSFYQCLSGFKNYITCNKVNMLLVNQDRADIRMLPIALTYFPKFVQSCVVATRDQVPE